jgi:hypothetical protein
MSANLETTMRHNKSFSFLTCFVGRKGWPEGFLWMTSSDSDACENYIHLASLHSGEIMNFIARGFGSQAVGCIFPFTRSYLDLVNGLVFSDETPFFDGLLENNQSYAVVYSMLPMCYV